MGRKVKETLYRKYFEGGKVNKAIKNCTTPSELSELWTEFIVIARQERNARLLNNIDIVRQCEKFIKEIETRINHRTDILDVIGYKDLLLKIERERGSLYRQGMGGVKSAKTKKANPRGKYSSWVTLNTHTYSVNSMYEYKYGILTRSIGYRTWIAKFPKWQVPTLEEYSCQGIDLFAPLGIEIQVVQKNKCDVDNGLKSILDRLVAIWGLPNDNHIACASIRKVGTCKNYEDGEIRFRVFNV